MTVTDEKSHKKRQSDLAKVIFRSLAELWKNVRPMYKAQVSFPPSRKLSMRGVVELHIQH